MKDITKTEIRKSIAFFDVLKSKSHWSTTKLDFSDICRHVLVGKKSGFCRELRFTPDDVDIFYKNLNRLL